MTPERWRQIEDIYRAALVREPSDRATLLTEVCAGDADLRREVESLLRYEAAAVGFIETPALEVAARMIGDDGHESWVGRRSGDYRLQPGAHLGPYEIIAPLGAGGMGEVYKAVDTRLDRTVAIKILPVDLAADPQRRERFRREARAISSLAHTHICTLHDIGEQNGIDFLVMEYLAGETLAHRLLRGPLPLEDVLQTAGELADALDAAHRQGVIHRDLKPANVMLTASGARVLDFGLAKITSPTRGGAWMMTEPTIAQRETLTGTGTVGTVAYMSPEQVRGEDIDARTDIFSFGVVLYEMLTGRIAFDAANELAVMEAVRSADPPSLLELRSDVPPDLERIVVRALIKDRSSRTISAADLRAEISQCRARLDRPQPSSGPVRKSMLPSRSMAIGTAALITTLAVVTVRVYTLSVEARWAREQALPEIGRLIEEDQIVSAFDLASRAERSIPNDPGFAKLRPLISRTASIMTDPSGADVFFREYGDASKPWREVGRTPVQAARVPAAFLQWRVEKSGYVPVEDTGGSSQVSLNESYSLSYRLDSLGAAPSGMVRVSSGGSPFAPEIHGADPLPSVEIADYWIDQYEVTNQEYQRFVHAGGYRDPRYWQYPIVDAGRTLTWKEAIDRMHDATGRTGPATWERGSYPTGQDDDPVTGVSWYEAAAYAAFAGKELPTIYHWSKVAEQSTSPNVVPLSNFSGRGLARAGSYRGMNRYGAYDMAGNAKEWVWNEANAGKRYILGGAWDEPDYGFATADARAPMERRPTFGFRCIKPISAATTPQLRQTLRFPSRNFDLERPVNDEMFGAYRAWYAYDKGNLNATVDDKTETDEWVREKVSFAAAYAGERVIAHLFLPKHAKPPFQTIVYFPGSGALANRSTTAMFTRYWDFIVRSGRAVMFPVYKSTYERGDGLVSDVPDRSNAWRDHVIAWSKDVGRSIDYLETRPDIASDKLAYVGLSWGAAMGAIMPAVEPRLKAVVLLLGGFNLQHVAPEVSALNFAPHVTAPTLMLSGRYDFFYPLSISQEPMFRFLGAPSDHKRRVIYDAGHNIPRPELMRETLDWLDIYLGPVEH